MLLSALACLLLGCDDISFLGISFLEHHRHITPFWLAMGSLFVESNGHLQGLSFSEGTADDAAAAGAGRGPAKPPDAVAAPPEKLHYRKVDLS